MKGNKRTLAVFTLVEHKEKGGRFYGYAPYIRQIGMWTSHFDKVIVVGPFNTSKQLGEIDLSYTHPNVSLVKVPAFNIKSVFSIINLAFLLPSIIYKMGSVMRSSDHLHFRCPSNVSAVAAVVQLFFPNKSKSTKYAGNWNPKSNQPLGYRFQKWLLSNTFFSKNMKVLVYGEWDNQPKSVIPFMAATYNKIESRPFQGRNYSGKLKFVFIGALVVGKRPLLTLKIIQSLIEKGVDLELHMFGDGNLKTEVEEYIKVNSLGKVVFIHGNQDKEIVKECLFDAHFTILPSKSEGWPKAIAEGMFFGAIPISTKISCLPWILDYGNRGILIEATLNTAIEVIISELGKGDDYLNIMSKKALEWSQQYTVDRVEQEIKKVIEE